MNETEQRKEGLEEAEEDVDLIKKATRPPRSGVTERLVCQSLFQGTFSDLPSKMIDHLCVAAMGCHSLMDNEEGKNEEASIDIDLIEKIYAINQSFENATSYKLQDGGTLMRLPWGFQRSEETYNKYVLPWKENTRVNYWSNHLDRHFLREVVRLSCSDCDYILGVCPPNEVKKIRVQWDDKKCPNCGSALRHFSDIYTENTVIVADIPDWDVFLNGLSQCLVLDSARELRNRFYAWAVPILEKVKMIIASYVSPQTYEDIARLFVGEEEKHDNNGNRDERPKL